MLKKLTASLLLFVVGQSLSAGPLTEARINKIINEVTVVQGGKGGRAAKLNDVVDEHTAVKTGIKSRSELLFQDNTLTRIGPETFFSFTPGTREMSLKEGTMLLQVPKGLGGAKIRTAAVTAAITGTTVMLEHKPGKHLKVLVLEGSLRLSVNGKFGDSLLLTPGKMVIMPPDAKRIPDPIGVDIAEVMKTSSLVKMSRNAEPLPSMALIQREIDLQARSLARARLIPTNLVINGAGTNVVMTDDVPLADLSRQQRPETRSTAAPSAVSAPTSMVATPTTPSTAPGGIIGGSVGITGHGDGRGRGNGGPAVIAGTSGNGR